MFSLQTKGREYQMNKYILRIHEANTEKYNDWFQAIQSGLDIDEVAKKIEKDFDYQIESPAIKPLRGSALLCEKNGWKVGDKLIGNEGYGDTIILLTAIGEENILAREISHNGKPSNRDEGHWTLSCREWRKVVPPKSTLVEPGQVWLSDKDFKYNQGYNGDIAYLVKSKEPSGHWVCICYQEWVFGGYERELRDEEIKLMKYIGHIKDLLKG